MNRRLPYRNHEMIACELVLEKPILLPRRHTPSLRGRLSRTLRNKNIDSARAKFPEAIDYQREFCSQQSLLPSNYTRARLFSQGYFVHASRRSFSIRFRYGKKSALSKRTLDSCDGYAASSRLNITVPRSTAPRAATTPAVRRSTRSTGRPVSSLIASISSMRRVGSNARLPSKAISRSLS